MRIAYSYTLLCVPVCILFDRLCEENPTFQAFTIAQSGLAAEIVAGAAKAPGGAAATAPAVPAAASAAHLGHASFGFEELRILPTQRLGRYVLFLDTLTALQPSECIAKARTSSQPRVVRVGD